MTSEFDFDCENLKYALDQAAIVSVANLMGKIIYANDMFIRVSGYSREEIINQNHRVIKSDVHSKEYFKGLWKTISSGQVWKGEICNRTKHGEYYWVDSTIIPFLNEKGRPYQYMAIRYLITEKKQVMSELAVLNANQEKIIKRRTEELKKSNELLLQREKMASLGGLVAGVAHEINTPIGVGVTAASHLQEEVKSFAKKASESQLTRRDLSNFIEDAEESTRIILSNLERAAIQIRSFKQVATDQSVEAKREFFVKEYLSEIILSLRPQLKKTKITVDIDCDEAARVNSYAGAFSQIVSNLVTNSLRYAFDENEEGNITLSYKVQGSTGFLEYIDTGKGMEPEVLKNIYEPFFTTGRDKGGTGLGMHIIYNVVTQKLQGKISCQSSPGYGIHVVIGFPL
mgnify:CR=1 FL=1